MSRTIGQSKHSSALGWRCAAVLSTALALLVIGEDAAMAQQAVEIDPILGPIGDNDHRLPYHLDSIIGLALVAYAVLVAALINNVQPRARVIGIWGAAVGCLGIAGGIVFLDLAGAFSDVRPPRLPVDNLKPILMRALATMFGLSAIVLSIVAVGQAKRRDRLHIGNRNTPARYGKIARYYHWTIAILFLLLIPMGVFTTMIPVDQAYRQAYYVIHKSLGLTVLILAAGRLVWLILSPAIKLDASLSGWEKFLAHGAHYTLYFFLFAFPISGFVLSTYGGKLSHFFFWDTPLLWEHSFEGTKFPGLLHKVILPYLFYLVFLAHILGALKHRFIDKHADAFRRMVT
ncbi:MAG: cytochrome b [Pseudomonadota bacterium]